MKIIDVREENWSVTIKVDGHDGSIESDGFRDPDDSDEYRAAIDGMESILLSLACAVIELPENELRDAINTSFAALLENYGD